MHTLLLGQVSYVEHNALLIVENHFVALKAENLFPLILRIYLNVLYAALRSLARVFDFSRFFFLRDNFERLTNESFRVPCRGCSNQAQFDSILLIDENGFVKKSLQVHRTDLASHLFSYFVLKYHLKVLLFSNSFGRVNKAMEACV